MKPTPIRNLSRRGPRPSHGVALLEALIAILIFSFGVLGIVGLQSSMIRAQSSAKFRGDASYLASELTGAMWSDIPNLVAGKYDTASASCAAYGPCAAWQGKVQAVLPGGTAVVTAPAAAASATITITWTVPGEGTHKYETNAAVQAAQ
jgi:type IV pilus assembly protein PilV